MKYRSCWCSFDFLLTKLHMIIISVQEIASVLTIDQTSKIAFVFHSEQQWFGHIICNFGSQGSWNRPIDQFDDPESYRRHLHLTAQDAARQSSVANTNQSESRCLSIMMNYDKAKTAFLMCNEPQDQGAQVNHLRSVESLVDLLRRYETHLESQCYLFEVSFVSATANVFRQLRSSTRAREPSYFVQWCDCSR